MAVDKTIRKGVDEALQRLENYRYWQSLPIGERLSVVWDVSEAAYAFAAAFKGMPPNDAEGSKRALTRVQRTWG